MTGTGTRTARCLSARAPAAAWCWPMLSLINPGDEVIVFDPYFVMYEPLVNLVGGRAVMIDTYPDFHIDLDQVADAIYRQDEIDLAQ